MDIRHMRQILAIRDLGSLAKAAKALNTSQPSLSHNLARLEDELKVKLVDRTAGGSVLTPIGLMIADRAARVIAESDNLRRDAALAAGGDRGSVRLGIDTALIQEFMPRLMLQIAEAHPNLDLHIEINERDQLVGALRARKLDVVFCAPGPERVDPTIVAKDFLTTELVVAASPDHPLAGQNRISAETLARYPCGGGVTLREPPSRRPAYYSPLPVEFDQLYTTNDQGVLLPLALTGQIVLLTPSFFVRPFIAAGALVRLDVDWEFKAAYMALVMRAASFSPILSLIVGYASDIGAALEQAPQAAELDPMTLMNARQMVSVVQTARAAAPKGE